jgi:hypothetical protein
MTLKNYKRLGVVFLACSFVPQAIAGLITNGGFESGFSNWTKSDQLGSEGSFMLQTGTTSPVSGDSVPAPPLGTAAMTDALGPGSHVLLQNFLVPSAVPAATLHFDLFVGNRAGTFTTPNTLDFSTPALNQQARVDILLPGADPFSLAAADVLMNVYRTNVGDPAVSGYTHLSFDVTSLLNAHQGAPLTLRFAETDNVFAFQLGIDNVDIDVGEAAVPEPAGWMLTSAGLAGAMLIRRVLGRRRP